VVFVIGHKPLGSLGGTRQERDDFWKLLNDPRVLSFRCGHTHVYDVYSDATDPIGQINTGSSAVQGVTGSDGTVTLSSGNMRSGTSVTFTVDNVAHDALMYDPAANVSTAITLTKPQR
jgi:hypothetical protein